MASKSATKSFKVEYADRNAWRIINDGQIVGFAVKMSSGGWRPADREFNLLSAASLANPNEVAAWFKENTGPMASQPAAAPAPAA